jgi:hypothetical protein
MNTKREQSKIEYREGARRSEGLLGTVNRIIWLPVVVMRSREDPERGGTGQQRFGLLPSPGGDWLPTYITRIRVNRRACVSSVVGASAHYGLDALQTATAVKLSRALWIISQFRAWDGRHSPCAGARGHNRSHAHAVSDRGRLSAKTLRAVGWRPFLQGVLLWLFISAVSLAVIVRFV